MDTRPCPREEYYYYWYQWRRFGGDTRVKSTVVDYYCCHGSLANHQASVPVVEGQTEAASVDARANQPAMQLAHNHVLIFLGLGTEQPVGHCRSFKDESDEMKIALRLIDTLCGEGEFLSGLPSGISVLTGVTLL